MMPAVCQDYGIIAAMLGVTSNANLSRDLASALRLGPSSRAVDLGSGACGDAAMIARATGAFVIGL
ncbi:MAG: hypothetical protein JOZ54_12705, partial [Acidobacteria bacterium]|nr:hypothetical protein [Acidobacteriota bacterium]